MQRANEISIKAGGAGNDLTANPGNGLTSPFSNRDESDIKVVGHLNIPGASPKSFALPVHGHSMYPTLPQGVWGIVRPIEDRQDIDWGQIYYIEYGDYRVWKRLIKDDDHPDSVILHSDNITEMVSGKPKYASKTIKLERINRLCLLTDILMKPSY